MMELISMRQQILDAPENWRKMHLLPDGTWRGVQKKAVYDALMAMDLTTATSDEVNATGIVPGIYRQVCDECLGYAESAVILDGDNESITLCPNCLRKAVALIESGKS